MHVPVLDVVWQFAELRTISPLGAVTGCCLSHGVTHTYCKTQAFGSNVRQESLYMEAFGSDLTHLLCTYNDHPPSAMNGCHPPPIGGAPG